MAEKTAPAVLREGPRAQGVKLCSRSIKRLRSRSRPRRPSGDGDGDGDGSGSSTTIIRATSVAEPLGRRNARGERLPSPATILRRGWHHWDRWGPPSETARRTSLTLYPIEWMSDGDPDDMFYFGGERQCPRCKARPSRSAPLRLRVASRRRMHLYCCRLCNCRYASDMWHSAATVADTRPQNCCFLGYGVDNVSRCRHLDCTIYASPPRSK